jgi:ubiquinone/menaquinone biosynthesis C-methylase UbiE
MLDVACGTGAVARGFSAYVDSIVAFDTSRNMLDIALEDTADYPNVQLLHTTFDDLDVPGDFDLVTFGRSIHLLDRDFTLSALRRRLKKDGWIIVCASGFSAENTGWIRAYYDVWSRWQSGKRYEKFDGLDVLRRPEFGLSYQISSKTTLEMSIDDLVNYALSYPGPAARIEAAKGKFRQELEIALLPFLRDGVIEARIVTWGNVFRFEP